MGTSYSGKAANVSQLGSVNIASSNNSTPISVSTATPHGMAEGAVVVIKNHLVNLAANGLWKIVVTGASSFQLYTLAGAASVGIGVGGATGTVSDLVPQPQYTIPADGESRSAAKYNTPLCAIGDQVAWLGQRVTGAYRVDQQMIVTIADAAFGGWPTSPFASAVAPGVSNVDVVTYMPKIDVVSNDLVDVMLRTSVTGITVLTAFTFWYQLVDYGAAAAFGGATRVAGSAQQFAAGYVGGLCLRGRVAVGALGRGMQLQMFMAAQGAAGAYAFVGDRETTQVVYRVSP